MVSSAGCFVYQLHASASAPTAACTTYCATSSGILSCYGLARHYNFVLGNQPVASRWHLMVHAWTGVGSLVLYDALGMNVAGWHAEQS